MNPTGNMGSLPPQLAPEVETAVEGGDLIVHYLRQIGVEYIFGVPGGPLSHSSMPSRATCVAVAPS